MVTCGLGSVCEEKMALVYVSTKSKRNRNVQTLQTLQSRPFRLFAGKFKVANESARFVLFVFNYGCFHNRLFLSSEGDEGIVSM